MPRLRRYRAGMKAKEIKRLVERQPSRPFDIRLNNGAQYTFKEARDVGAPKDYHIIFYFGENKAWPRSARQDRLCPGAPKVTCALRPTVRQNLLAQPA
jgi:hypothetical protein